MSATKVVHVLSRGDTFGGAQLYVARASEHLRSNASEMEILVGRGGSFADHLVDSSYRVERTRSGKGLRSLVRETLYFRKKLKAEPESLFVGHSTLACAQLRMAAVGLPNPVVLTIHGSLLSPDRPLSHRLAGMISEFVLSRLRPTTMVCISETDRGLLSSRVIGRRNRLELVENWAEWEQPTDHDRSTEVMTIGMVARLAPPKRPDLVIRALACLPEDIRLELVGSGPMDKALEELSEQLGVQDRVRMVGEIAEIHEHIGRWDLGVLVSDWEGLPLSVIEYLRAGLPVLASDVGAVRELVDSRCGQLLGTNNLSELCQAVFEFYASSQLRERLSEGARAAYEQKFSDRTQLPKLQAVYEGVFDTQPQGRVSNLPRSKRLIDLLLAGALTVPALFFVLLLWFPLMLETRGNPIFSQIRVGQYQEPFRMIKLRTMRSRVASDLPSHLAPNDAVGRIGRLTRKLKLDELPQILNIVRGQMSFVGPRPCLPTQVDLIELREARGVFSVPPGITGYSQLEGLDMSEPDALAAKDAEYVASVSLRTDFDILRRTFGAFGHHDAAR